MHTDYFTYASKVNQSAVLGFSFHFIITKIEHTYVHTHTLTFIDLILVNNLTIHAEINSIILISIIKAKQ